MSEEVCVKWVEDKCVKWETRKDGGLTLNLKSCPRKLREKIKKQLSKGLEVSSKLEPEPEPKIKNIKKK